MKRFLAVVVAVVALGLVAAACSGVFDVRASVETYCATPVPIFSANQAAAQDSVPFGCPFGYIDAAGDTILFIPAATLP
jgi:hypothetical protein